MCKTTLKFQKLGLAGGGGAAGPSSVEPVVLPVQQLMADAAERCPRRWTNGWQSDMLTVVAEVLCQSGQGQAGCRQTLAGH
uniref:Uncharacterized protein n=1 Tax=Globodera rostochiensis TaxID=31243 RepID=A0A914H3Y8_GLORO